MAELLSARGEKNDSSDKPVSSGEEGKQQQFTAINPAAFKGGFSEASLLAYLVRDVLKERSGGATRSTNLEGTAPAVARASLDKVQKLLGTLDK